MSEIIKKCAEVNYQDFVRYYNINCKKMSIEENIKNFTKLKRLEKIYFDTLYEDSEEYF